MSRFFPFCFFGFSFIALFAIPLAYSDSFSDALAVSAEASQTMKNYSIHTQLATRYLQFEGERLFADSHLINFKRREVEKPDEAKDIAFAVQVALLKNHKKAVRSYQDLIQDPLIQNEIRKNADQMLLIDLRQNETDWTYLEKVFQKAKSVYTEGEVYSPEWQRVIQEVLGQILRMIYIHIADFKLDLRLYCGDSSTLLSPDQCKKYNFFLNQIVFENLKLQKQSQIPLLLTASTWNQMEEDFQVNEYLLMTLKNIRALNREVLRIFPFLKEGAILDYGHDLVSGKSQKHFFDRSSNRISTLNRSNETIKQKQKLRESKKNQGKNRLLSGIKGLLFSSTYLDDSISITEEEYEKAVSAIFKNDSKKEALDPHLDQPSSERKVPAAVEATSLEEFSKNSLSLEAVPSEPPCVLTTPENALEKSSEPPLSSSLEEPFDFEKIILAEREKSKLKKESQRWRKSEVPAARPAAAGGEKAPLYRLTGAGARVFYSAFHYKAYEIRTRDFLEFLRQINGGLLKDGKSSGSATHFALPNHSLTQESKRYLSFVLHFPHNGNKPFGPLSLVTYLGSALEAAGITEKDVELALD